MYPLVKKKSPKVPLVAMVLTNFCVPRGPRFGGAVRRGPPLHAKIDTNMFLLAWTFHENIFEAKASRKPGENLAKTLRKPCENLAKTLRKPCEILAKQFFPSDVAGPFLKGFYVTIYGVSRKSANVTQIHGYVTAQTSKKHSKNHQKTPKDVKKRQKRLKTSKTGKNVKNVQNFLTYRTAA